MRRLAGALPANLARGEDETAAEEHRGQRLGRHLVGARAVHRARIRPAYSPSVAGLAREDVCCEEDVLTTSPRGCLREGGTGDAQGQNMEREWPRRPVPTARGVPLDRVLEVLEGGHHVAPGGRTHERESCSQARHCDDRVADEVEVERRVEPRVHELVAVERRHRHLHVAGEAEVVQGNLRRRHGAAAATAAAAIDVHVVRDRTRRSRGGPQAHHQHCRRAKRGHLGSHGSVSLL